jgi:transcriptional regulator with XRE-family HTH domain
MAKKTVTKEMLNKCGECSLTLAERFMVLNARVKDLGFQGLGEYLGVHRVTVSGWVTGKRMPDAAACKKLLEICTPLVSAAELSGSPSPGRGRPKKEKEVELDILKPMPRQKQKPVAKPDVEEADDWGF